MATTESSSTSRSLLEGLRLHRTEQWQRFVTVYSPLIARWCWKQGLRGNDAVEVIQEVHAIVFEHILDFDHDGPEATFRGWLYTITRNTIAGFCRQRNQQRELDPQSAAALVAPVDADEDQDDLAGLIQRTLQLLEDEEELPKGPREAFLAHFFEQKAMGEIASEMELSLGAVRNRINRAASKLREILAQEFQHLTGESNTPPSVE